MYPRQFAIGVSSGAEKMIKQTSFHAAQLSRHQWLIPDVYNAYMKLDREEACNDMCEVQPHSEKQQLHFTLSPTIYVHDTRGAHPRKYGSVPDVIQGCKDGINTCCVSQRKPAEWIPKTAQAARRGHTELPVVKTSSTSCQRSPAKVVSGISRLTANPGVFRRRPQTLCR